MLLLFLTVLCDEGDAAVHDDGDVVPAQLLFPQSVSFPAGRSLNVRVPKREVCPTDALQVQSPEETTRNREEDQLSKLNQNQETLSRKPLTVPSPLKPGCLSSRGSRSRRQQYLQHKQRVSQTSAGFCRPGPGPGPGHVLSSCRRFRLMMSSAAPSCRGQMKRLDFCRTK